MRYLNNYDLLEVHSICGGHYTAIETQDGSVYFMTQSGISTHHSMDHMELCLNEHGFLGFLDITYSAIPLALELLTIDGLPDYLVREINSNIIKWQADKPVECELKTYGLDIYALDYISKKTLKMPKEPKLFQNDKPWKKGWK